MQPATPRLPFYRSLYVQVLTAILIGVLIGHFAPDTGVALKPLGDGFIKLIKMIIAPIIFCTVVVGIAGMEDMKKVGKTGGYALLYFEIVSSLALVIGLVIVNLVQPGAGMDIDPATLDTKGIAAYTAPGKMQTTVEFLLAIIPTTVVDAFAKGEMLQVLLIAIMFGFALHRFGGRGTLIFDFIEKLSHVLFAIVGTIMKVAPIGATFMIVPTMANSTCESFSMKSKTSVPRPPKRCSAKPNSTASSSTCSISPLAKASTKVLGMMPIRNSTVVCILPGPT